MPRYRFNVWTGTELIRDDEGDELPDFEAALFEARMSMRELAIECLRSGQDMSQQYIEIADELGTRLGLVRIEDVASFDTAH